jgi:hypothetical protein
MGKLEKIVLAEPPALRAPAVIVRLRIAERELADLKLQVPERVLAVAEGKPGAREALTTLHQKIAVIAFEIECSGQARQLAERLDEHSMVDFKAAVQTLPVEQILEGLSKETCCRRCIPGTGCAITASDPLSGPCQHPLIGGALELTRYRTNPKIQAIYSAACAKLGVRNRS